MAADTQKMLKMKQTFFFSWELSEESHAVRLKTSSN